MNMKPTFRKPVASMTDAEIVTALRDDGFEQLIPHVPELRAAAVRGALIWTEHFIRTTDHNRFDVRKEARDAAHV